MKPVPKNWMAMIRKMATPIISPENVGPPPYSSSLGFLPRPSFSARARTRAPRAGTRACDVTARDAEGAGDARLAGVPGRDASATTGPARRCVTRWVGAETRTAVAVEMDAVSGHAAVACHVG